MLSCGEPSGDLYAAALAREIRAADPSATITGFGGERLRAAGAELVGDFSGLSVTGLLEVARVLPRTYGMYRRLIAHARAERPDVFVAIDFPDFNFRLAGALRRLGIPVVYYISPQLWAWRPGRMKTMREIADRVLVIFSSGRHRTPACPSVGRAPAARRYAASAAEGSGASRSGADAGRAGRGLAAWRPPQQVRAILPGWCGNADRRAAVPAVSSCCRALARRQRDAGAARRPSRPASRDRRRARGGC